MADAIRPALTPEAWERARDCFLSGREEGLGMEYVFALLNQEFDTPQFVAVFNDALPDGHPNKVTREDVEALARTADNAERWIHANNGRSGDRDYVALDRARAAVAKIAALLSPDA